MPPRATGAAATRAPSPEPQDVDSTVTRRKSALLTRGSPRKDDTLPVKLPKAADGTQGAETLEGVAEAISQLPVLEQSLRAAIGKLDDRDFVELTALRAKSTAAEAENGRLTKAMQDMHAAHQKAIEQFRKDNDALRTELRQESTKAAKFEARSDALEERIKELEAQRKLWHEMFVDLQDRCALRVRHANMQ